MRLLSALLFAAWLTTAAAVAADTGRGATSQPVVEELRPILSPDAKREAARQLIDRFVDHVRQSPDIAASARNAVANAWKEHRADEDPTPFLSAGVAIIAEPFKDAMEAMDEEKYARADEMLQTLSAAKDPYIAMHASALRVRALVEQEKLEEAEKVLTPLVANEKDLIDKTFLETEADFLLGYCQLSNLRYDQALETLLRFERQHPDAPERFRLPARQMLQELSVREPEGLGEVSDLMVYSSRRLANGYPGKQVQIKQDHSIDLLNKLIKKAEEQEQQQSGGGGGGSGGNKQGKPGSPGGRSTKGADRSMLPGGQGHIGDLHRSPPARPGDEWGKMRPEDRDKILQSLRKNFPSRYRQLVEQYYKQLAKER